jgi:hypothetical protein
VDQFAILLDDLGGLIQVPLHPDHQRKCHLSINGDLHLQLTEDEQNNQIVCATFIAEIPPGKFRENILKEALKENTLFPRLGSFSYSERNSQLALVSHLSFTGLHGDTMADFLELFIEKAFAWRAALATGQIPVRSQKIITS